MDYPNSLTPSPSSTAFVNNNNNPNATNPFQNIPQNPFATSTQDVNNAGPPPNLSNSFIAFDPIELIGQNTSTFDSKTNDKFFNQSSQIHLTEAVSEGSHLVWNNEEFSKRSDNAFQTSTQHASVLVAKQKQEIESQHLHNSLWTFPVQQKTLNSMCGDDRSVTYTFQVKMASFNEHNFGILNLKFNELHNMNTTSVYSTLFEQSLSEIQLSNYIHASLNSWKSDARSIKSILDNLFDMFQSTRKPVSAHTATEIRQLIMFVGSFLLDYLPSETKTEDNLLFNIEDENQRLKSISQIIPSISTYFLTKILPVQGCSWSISLLQPSETDVIQFRWLEHLFNTSTLYDENEYLLILGQIPWRQIGARCSVEDVKKHVLLPLQKALEILSPRPNYARLVLTLGKIVSLIACMFPTLLVQCLANLTRSPWPSKMIFSTLLNMLPWKFSNTEDLSVIFSELLHLFNVKMQDYSAMVEEKKSPMRLQYRDYLLHNQMLISQTYLIDPLLSDFNGKSRFPTLVALTTLCIHAISMGDLEPARILSNELFFFSFICPVPQHPEAASWMPFLRTEASNQLGRLCTQYPPAMNWVVNSIGQGLPSLNPEQIDYFLTNQVSLVNWKLDQSSLNWLSYLLAHRALPQVVDINNAADLYIQHYLFAKPQVSFPPQVNAVGIRIGCKLYESIQWNGIDAFIRNTALLILLAGKSIGITPDWLFTTISKLKHLISAPFHDQFMNKLLQLRTVGLFCEDEVTLVQILLAVAIVEDKPKQQGFKWLEDWGLYGRLENIVSKNIKGNAFQNILFHIMNLVKFDAYRAAPAISKVIFTALAKNPALMEDAKQVLGKSLQEPKDHDRWLVLWSLLLCPRTPENQHFCSLLNLLVQQIFYESETTMDIVIQPLISRNIGKKEINKLISDKFLWMAYAAVQAYQPALPIELTSILTMTDSNIAKAVKDTRFWYLKEIAMNMEDGVLALLFWEQFFLLYFELNQAVANKIITNSVREQLNKHFVSTAQDYSNIKKVYTLYYSFTTWSKDVIIGNRPNVFLLGEAEEGPSILESMVSLYPIQFPAISDLAKQTKALSVTSETSPDLPVLINQFLSLLIKKTPRYQRVPIEEFKLFLQEVLHIADKLEHNADVEIIAEMRELMFQYYAAVHSLKSLDDLFLNLTKSLYVNYAEPFTATVPCSFGPQCASPGLIRGQNVRIASATPTTREDILKNREQFNKLYSDFFTLSRKIAYKQSILDHLGQYLLQPATVNPKAGVTLFFSLSKLILSNIIPLDTISKRLNQLTRDLGSVYIKNKPEHQQQLLNLLLSFSRAQMPTTSTEKYLNYLYECFTPSCHLELQDYSSYIQLIGILADVPTALPVNEERQIAARFEAERWVPIILPLINQTQFESIFEMLPGLMTKTSLIPLCSVLVQSLISISF